nr:cupin domain-containing protein [Cellulosimicrobium arenosum]
MDALPPATDGRTQVHVARVAAGGTIGRHRATRTQVFAVVAGECTVVGDDDARATVTPGRLALWSPGEEHQSWAVSDSVVVVLETDGDVELGGRFRAVAGDPGNRRA